MGGYRYSSSFHALPKGIPKHQAQPLLELLERDECFFMRELILFGKSTECFLTFH